MGVRTEKPVGWASGLLASASSGASFLYLKGVCLHLVNTPPYLIRTGYHVETVVAAADPLYCVGVGGVVLSVGGSAQVFWSVSA